MHEKDQNPIVQKTEVKKRGKGGRPRSNPADVRAKTIGVRVSTAEFSMIKANSDELNITPADWLRKAALSRRLPSPPVPSINRAQYAELGRLAGNLNQLTRLLNEGQKIVIDELLLHRLISEVKVLRLELIGAAQ